MVMAMLAMIPRMEDFAIPVSSSSSDLMESVLTIPLSPTSYIHEKMMTMGKPSMANTTKSLIVHSGIKSAGMIIWAACKITNAVARYMAALLKTLRFFNSDIKLDIVNDY